MNEEQLTRLLILLGVIFGGVFGALTFFLLIAAAAQTNGYILTAAVISGAASVGLGFGSWLLATGGSKDDDGISSPLEKAVLDNRQRRELRKARADIVMQTAMIEVQQEQENIVHRMHQDANDPDKPPHHTAFTQRLSPQFPSLQARDRERTDERQRRGY